MNLQQAIEAAAAHHGQYIYYNSALEAKICPLGSEGASWLLWCSCNIAAKKVALLGPYWAYESVALGPSPQHSSRAEQAKIKEKFGL